MVNLCKGFHFAETLCREAEQFSTSFDASFGLCDTSLDIIGGSVGHCLNTNRVFAADFNITHFGGGSLPAVVSQLYVHKSPNLVQSYANILD